MSKITGKVNYKEVLKGDTGYTFEPHITVDGTLYWTNNGNLKNPLPVNLHGKQGFMFIPHVDSEGNLSWSNTGELENPPTVNIKGDNGYFYTPHISDDGILTWSNNGNLENPQPFDISDLILNEVKESRVDTTGKTFSKLKERLDSDFKKLSESIKNNDTKDEVVQARTATTGENFMSLDDRIDHEVMRLREKIDVTMLKQEDKESHTIDNSIEGLTTDMIIKGKTLQNLVNIREATLNKEVVFEDDIIKFRKIGSDITYLQMPFLSKPNTTYTIMYTIVKNNVEQPDSENYILYPDGTLGDFNSIANTFPENGQTGLNKICLNTKSSLFGALSFGFHLVNVGAEIWIKDLMVLEGNWLNKTIPTYFEGINFLGKEEEIVILSQSENLCPESDLEIGTILPTNGLIVSSTNKLRTKEYLFFPYNGQFYIKLSNDKFDYSWFFFYDSNKQIISSIDRTKNLVIDIPTDTKYIKYLINKKDDTEITEKELNEMLKVRIQLTEKPQSNYKSYKQYKKNIPISKYGFNEGLRSIKEAQDELNSIRNIAIKRIGKREYREGDLLLDNVITDKVNTYYVLEEPIETPLNENINTRTFNDKTYLSFENSVKGTSSFKVPVNTNKLINDLKFEKEDLKEKFNNLTNEFENFKTLMIQTLPYKGV